MFARGATPKIIEAYQNLCAAVGRAVKDEIVNARAFGSEAHFVKQPFFKASALNGFEELFWDDHVGIDVDNRKRCGGSG